MTAAAEQLNDEELELSPDEETEGPDEETIALAKSMGWVDEDKFRGDDSKWVDADKFVEKGMNDLPVLRERLRAQSKKLGEMETDINAFKTHHEDSLSREYQRAMTELEDKQRATVEDGNTEEYERIQKQKRTLSQSHARNAGAVGKPADNPLYTDWKEKNNSWFEKDADMTEYANYVSDKIAEDNPLLVGKQGFLDEVERKVRVAFSDKFKNPQRDAPNTVEAGGRTHRVRGSKTYSDLPSDAKAACDKFVRRGLITQKQYVQDYEWGE